MLGLTEKGFEDLLRRERREFLINRRIVICLGSAGSAQQLSNLRRGLEIRTICRTFVSVKRVVQKGTNERVEKPHFGIDHWLPVRCQFEQAVELKVMIKWMMMLLGLVTLSLSANIVGLLVGTKLIG